MAIPMVAPPNTFGLGDQRNIFTASAARPLPPRANERVLPQQGTAPTAPGAAGGRGSPSEGEMLAAMNSPEYAIAAFRRAKTGGKRDLSSLGDFREGLL